MTCPGCGKDTPSEKNFCEHCGFSLYGPQSILLNEPEMNNSDHTNLDKSNIVSITGIDINSIDTSAYTPAEAANYNKTLSAGPKKKKVDRRTLILIFLLMILIALCGWIMFGAEQFAECPEQECEKCPEVSNTTEPQECPSAEVKGQTVYTDNYIFMAPTGYDFYEKNDGSVVLKSSNILMGIYPLSSGTIDTVTSGTISEKYAGYGSVNVEETILSQRKAFLVTYAEGSYYYLDFYYQHNAGRIVYGQVRGEDRKIISGEEVKAIISSFTIRENELTITYTPSGTDQNEILELFK